MEEQIIAKIKELKMRNEDGWAYVTDRAQKSTKNIVRKVRQFYEDAYAGENGQIEKNKFFFPLTKTVVDSMAASLDFDTKDILITSRKPEKAPVVGLLRELNSVHLAKRNFGQLLNAAMINFCRDGVVVTRTTEEDGYPETYIIDLLNFWTDFSTFKPNWFLERILKKREECPKEWNLPEKQNSVSVFENGGDTNREEIELWRWEGLAPMSWVTYNPEHTQSIWLMMVMTGLRDGQKTSVVDMKILGDTREASTYDFAQYSSNQNRFISCGVGEAVMGWQAYFNKMYNNRIDLSTLHSKGVWQIKKGSGISPDMISSIASGGGIPVNQIGADIAPLQISGTNNDNFLEEQRGLDAIQRLTGVTPISQGLQDKSGATLGEVNLTAGFSNSRFKFQRQNFAFMFQRILKRWAEIIVKNMGTEEIVKVSDEKLRESLAEMAAAEEMLQMLKRNLKEVGVGGVNRTIQETFIKNDFFSKHFQKNAFKLLKKSLKDLDYVIEISMTNENKNIDQLTKNKMQLIQLASDLPELDVAAVLDSVYNDLGISLTSLKGKSAGATQLPQQPIPQA